MARAPLLSLVLLLVLAAPVGLAWTTLPAVAQDAGSDSGNGDSSADNSAEADSGHDVAKDDAPTDKPQPGGGQADPPFTGFTKGDLRTKFKEVRATSTIY